MFGQDDDKKGDATQPDLEAPTPDQEDGGAQPGNDQPAVSIDTNWENSDAVDGSSDNQADNNQSSMNDVVSPAGGFPRSTDAQVSSHPAPPAPPPIDDIVNVNSTVQDLIDIRQHALTELAPLLDQLELSPEDRFRIIMLVIQASDDQKLIKEAYEAAHGITDEKVRAQALFDLVNEINYFTQQAEN
jgi:hypothetical protein